MNILYRLITIIVLQVLSFSSFAQIDDILGTWKTIDDATGKEKSHVKIFKATNGFYYGKVVKLIGQPADKKCVNCKGSLKDQPIVGMMIVTKMIVDGKELADGKIMDPANGKFYYCSISLDENDKTKLIVRGSVDAWGIAGRSQTWIKVKE